MNDLKTTLENAIGKSIDRICPNKFHNLSANHCAHFVSHMTGLEFSFQCREFKGGNGQPGNVRVHEIFAQCPKVGKFVDKPSDRPVLAFVTRKDMVDLHAKRMRNIPQKHIGVFLDGSVYHYSNSNNEVVKWSPSKFLDVFQQTYSGDQGLFYGIIPNSDLRLRVDPSAVHINQGIAFSLDKREGNKWFARAVNSDNGQEFYVGQEVRNRAKKYFGIFRRSIEYDGPQFAPEDYWEDFDHWAYLLYLTGHCESKNFFNVFNTYDRAKFTFGFYQLAAHTPNDNLILFFRRLTELQKATDYFPEIKMLNGRLTRVNEDGGTTDLETIMNTGPNGQGQLQLFMNYLNPFRKKIDEQEVLQLARIIHWTINDPGVCSLQVEIANEILQRKMSQHYNRWYELDGKSDLICALIADIHHQGRATKSRVKTALKTADPIEALITVNPRYTGRIANLREVSKKLIDEGKLGHKVYDGANNEFV